MITAGVDAGSRAIKVVFYDHNGGEILTSGVTDQGIEQNALARGLFERLLKDKGLRRDEVDRIIATGYGRSGVEFADTTVTEITCHARGVLYRVPEARTIIEIGGQDSKVIWLDGQGRVRDFGMNDRCAAGTGRFLEVVAERLDVDLAELGRLARESTAPAIINSTCVVFAETEIIGLLATGVPTKDILAGILMSLGRRVASMAGRRVEQPILLTGGVALVSGVAEELASCLEQRVQTAPQPQMTGALGAALLAAE